MKIHIDTLEIDAIIGLLDSEREKTQKIIVHLEVSYDYQKEQFIDYADIVLLIENDLKSKRYRLLEEALVGIKDILLRSYPQTKRLRLKIAKPDILKQCSVAISSHWVFEKER